MRRAANRVLKRFGIDAKRYWLLMDLFALMSDRGEISDQLGLSSSLKVVGWLYFGLSVLLGAGLAIDFPPARAYSAIFLAMTAFLLSTVLVTEAGNSLVNPVEGVVLAHQPVDGATFVAAKLSHLLRIVLYLVPALNVVPALLGLTLKGARWWFPFAHMAAALAVGVLMGLLCCALFGWLLRFIPAKRLKAAAQIASAAPMLGVFVMNSTGFFPYVHMARWIPFGPGARWAIAPLAGAAAVAIVVLGIRSLSADYLIRASTIARGGSKAGPALRRRPVEVIVARVCGGPGSRAGFAYVSRMARRDYQFRRQLVPLLPAIVMGVAGVVKGARVDPFSGQFTVAHLIPHMFGVGLLMICSVMQYGNEYKGSWIFQLAPQHVFAPFARGVYAFLFNIGVLTPAVAMFLGFAWFWGAWHAALFAVFSAAVIATYLGFTLQLVKSIPFSQQPTAARGALMLPLLMLTSGIAAIAVAAQYFLVFSSQIAVLATAIGLAAACYFLTRRSLGSFAANMRFSLGQLAGESKLIYKEIDA